MIGASLEQIPSAVRCYTAVLPLCFLIVGIQTFVGIQTSGILIQLPQLIFLR